MSGQKPPSVYLETSFISYATNRLSNDFLVSAHQRLSRRWWEQRREHFRFFVSEVVVAEIIRGDESAVRSRVEFLGGIESIILDDASSVLAKSFLDRSTLPKKAAQDALHVAVAAVNGIDYLLSWNCKHIVNLEVYSGIQSIIEESGYRAPKVCTPYELMGDVSHD
ncbi:type II toxin-antitoxin system VapC family toxin [bacterium]|nr:type II toxin-antitoxin system VapC family toxin [bacterium]